MLTHISKISMGGEMLTYEEILNLSKDEFVEKWNSGEIQESSLALLGYRYVSEEEKDQSKDESQQ